MRGGQIVDKVQSEAILDEDGLGQGSWKRKLI